MPATVWKGHITFGLVSIPVKLYRAARPERVKFRQLHRQTGSRVRQKYVAEPGTEPSTEPVARADVHEFPSGRREAEAIAPPAAPAFKNVSTAGRSTARAWEPEPPEREVDRSELAKGYEFDAGQFVMLTREDLEKITPRTARDMQILEFVRLDEVDPLHFETSYYVAPDRGGERPYALLFEALRQSRYAGVAQLAMHNREHIVLIRPGRRGLVLHTMFYENEVHRTDEYAADVSGVSGRELELAHMLFDNLAASFDPGKYRDSYQEKLNALIEAKIAGRETLESPEPRPTPVVNILEALQRTLEGMPARKPPEKQQSPAAAKRKRK